MSEKPVSGTSDLQTHLFDTALRAAVPADLTGRDWLVDWYFVARLEDFCRYLSTVASGTAGRS